MAIMNCGTRSYGPASLLVAIPKALPARMHDRVREIVSVYVPEDQRRQGLASELLTRTVREAKRTDTVLILSVDEEPLQAFYARFGFRLLQTEPEVLMVCQ